MLECPDSWRMQTTLPKFLKQLNIPGIQGIDTRELVRKLRVHGTLRGKIANSKNDQKKLLKFCKRRRLLKV